MLAISGVHAFYGNIEALRGVDLEVGRGEIVALIGANGAGKSTLLMTVCGRGRRAGAFYSTGGTSLGSKRSKSSGMGSPRCPKADESFRG
jgi:branched-chain amino acid transport system ATP-binding protein